LEVDDAPVALAVGEPYGRLVEGPGRLGPSGGGFSVCGGAAQHPTPRAAAEDGFTSLDGPLVRITTPHVPLPAADALEDAALPSVARIVETVAKGMD
jgi:hypothetical protein